MTNRYLSALQYAEDCEAGRITYNDTDGELYILAQEILSDAQEDGEPWGLDEIMDALERIRERREPDSPYFSPQAEAWLRSH